jgi:hypothetical protein
MERSKMLVNKTEKALKFASRAARMIALQRRGQGHIESVERGCKRVDQWLGAGCHKWKVCSPPAESAAQISNLPRARAGAKILKGQSLVPCTRARGERSKMQVAVRRPTSRCDAFVQLQLHRRATRHVITRATGCDPRARLRARRPP